ncbi:MAG: hydroxyacid dehydrogenase [Oscillospiraceae bacterium]
MKSLFIGDKNNIDYVFSDAIKLQLSDVAALRADLVLTRDDFAENKSVLRECDTVFTSWGFPTLSKDELAEYLPNLKAVFYAAGSVQYFAKDFIETGIKVFSAWGANAVPVAEYTLAQILLANKGFYGASRLMKAENHTAAAEYFGKYPGNYNCNVGIIGAGMIGKLVIRLLKSYKISTLVFDPFLPKSTADELGVRLVTLPELFKSCQTISNHLSNNAQTAHMLNYELFSSMKPHATFINTGRGRQVVESDLCHALAERPDLTALLDVTDPEPSATGHPFYALPNVVLTPHIAGSSGQEVGRMAEYMLEEFLKHKSGQPTSYEVTLKMLETMA